MTSRIPSFDSVLSPLDYRDDHVALIDQTALPGRLEVLRIATVSEMVVAIQRLAVRGAPAIGIAAAYGMVLASRASCAPEHMAEAAEALRAARPTAVNLGWALDRMLGVFRAHEGRSQSELRAALLEEARRIHAEDIEGNKQIGRFGADLLPNGCSVLTICNTGALATGGYGTALGVVRAAWAQKKLTRVYACETRPLLQGARLNAWELLQEGIPFRVLVDSAAGALLAQGRVQAVLVGADRIARNGDTANKIGTYTLAVLAARHRVPFYVVAPASTVDLRAASGEAIPIEERGPEEVLAALGRQVAPQGAEAWNPAFDVTPAELIAGIVSEHGVLRPPYEETIPAACAPRA